jgi:hypothetical protein
MAFLTLQPALDRARERSQAASSDDAYLTELLELSAGEAADGTTVHYRPYYVAAKFLEQNLARQQISAADGATFTLLKKPIESLLDLQSAYDRAQGLSVPAGFEAVPDDCKVCSSYGSSAVGGAYRAVSVRGRVG